MVMKPDRKTLGNGVRCIGFMGLWRMVWYKMVSATVRWQLKDFPIAVKDLMPIIIAAIVWDTRSDRKLAFNQIWWWCCFTTLGKAIAMTCRNEWPCRRDVELQLENPAPSWYRIYWIPTVWLCLAIYLDLEIRTQYDNEIVEVNTVKRPISC